MNPLKGNNNIVVSPHALIRFNERVSKMRKRRILENGTALDYLTRLAQEGTVIERPGLYAKGNYCGETYIIADRDAVVVCTEGVMNKGEVVILTTYAKGQWKQARSKS